MTIRELISSLKANEVMYVRAPEIQLKITGTIMTTIGPRGLIEVIYDDLTEQKRVADSTILDRDVACFTLMDFVSFVQAGGAIARQLREFDVSGDSRMTGGGNERHS